MVAIVCLTLALIAALGWVFYMNFINNQVKPHDEKQPVVSKKSIEPIANIKSSIQLRDRTLSITHTSDWVSEKRLVNQDGMEINHLYIKSPDHQYKVHLSLQSGGQMGGGCLVDTTTFVTADMSKLNNDADRVFLQAIIKLEQSSEPTYMSVAKIIDAPTDVSAFSAEKGGCTGILSGIYTGYKDKLMSATAEIFSSRVNDVGELTSEKEAMAVFDNPTYKKARDIILTLEIK